ncbi:MAG TPA: prepilin-type N-terminal cleavage/methylation domain-containing protein [Phycisphaerae bacterium]|nr:prepilin-type N-terminal cleavage/methylation domain-containing protein [Phycisphaerae bacterium]
MVGLSPIPLAARPGRRGVARQRRRRGFSLVEILISLFILLVGTVILATIFPVAGDWTRQATEHSVAQTIARDAVALIKAHCTAANFEMVSYDLEPLTVDQLMLSEFDQGYAYPGTTPMPQDARSYEATLYRWAALARHQPADPAGSYQVYILVFKKGEVRQQFGDPAPPEGYVLVNDLPPLPPGHVRDPLHPPPDRPVFWRGPYRDGTQKGKNGQPLLKPRLFPPIGDYGIGVRSGTVFRQHLAPDGLNAAPSTPLIEFQPSMYEDVYYAPPLEGTNVSSLVYVYQTTLAF